MHNIITLPLEKNKLRQFHVHKDIFNLILIIFDYMYNFSTDKNKILDLMIKFAE